MMSLASPSTSSVNQNNRRNQKHSTDAPQATKGTAADSGGIGGRAQHAMQSLEQNIWLPDSPTTFAFYIVVIAVLCGGLFLHINLSAQITRTQYDIAETRRNFYEVERESAEIVSQIALATAMLDIYGRAKTLGYVPVTDKSKNFVAAADIRIPLPEVASSANDSVASNSTIGDSTSSNSTTSENATVTGITVAEALEAQDVMLAGASELGSGELGSGNALALGINSVGTFPASNGSDLAQGSQNETTSFTTQLIKWWTSE